jgi:pantoate--beta-alanine ligase
LGLVQVIDRVPVWRKALDAERAAGRVVGVVPTMGALHAGHAALIDRAARECDVVGVTVFVNPLQFAGGEDFDAYPRPLERDEEIAAAHGAAYLFAPSVEEMYPRPVETVVSVPSLSARWDGDARPGHFDGVATVVTKLLAQAGPCRAYFGEKDYQQLCVVRRLVADLDLPTEVVGCATVRDADGLALSSRNAYLSPAEREVAPLLHRALTAGAAVLERGGSPDDCRAAMQTLLAAEPRFTLIYAEPVDPGTLEPLATALPVGGAARLLAAARLGRARLIDNLGVTR